ENERSRRGVGPEERRPPDPAPGRQAAEHLPGAAARQGRRLWFGQGPGGGPGGADRGDDPDVRPAGDVRRVGEPADGPVQPGHRLPGDAHRQAAVPGVEPPPTGAPAPDGATGRGTLAAGRRAVLGARATPPGARSPPCADFVRALREPDAAPPPAPVIGVEPARPPTPRAPRPSSVTAGPRRPSSSPGLRTRPAPTEPA